MIKELCFIYVFRLILLKFFILVSLIKVTHEFAVETSKNIQIFTADRNASHGN